VKTERGRRPHPCRSWLLRTSCHRSGCPMNAHVVRQRTRIKNQVHAILARNLAPTPPVWDLLGRAGRPWLSRQELPTDERSSVSALLRQLDFHTNELAVVDKELAIEALSDPAAARSMTIPGVDAIAGISIVAVIGEFTLLRPEQAHRLYRAQPAGAPVWQLRPGPWPDQQARSRSRPRCARRGSLSDSRAAGPLRAFYQASKPVAASRKPSSPPPAR
jgi:transposase